ncbi:MAG: carboxypeptidase-like regulatory domain-containing protein [Chitinophagaceae bacterium]|nr:carboxypeptidase-like regulatory domain-containing protein [Chitinophagaceae bacterium]
MKQLLLLLMIISGFTYAEAQTQTGIVKGFVYEKANGEPIIGATVSLKDKNKGTQTNINGFFTLSKIEPGEYTLIITSIGFENLEKVIKVEADEANTQKIYLEKRARELKGVQISAKREDKIYETKVGMTRITPKELKILPSIGGEPDIAQFLQVMPGVISTGDQGGQLYIRGGSPIQNKILLDGMTIYNPFHSIGLYSVFETDAIRSADVMSGGFGVEYGDRTSAIVNVVTKDGNKKHNGGKIAINPILAKVFLEGPILRDKEDSSTSITYIASLKHSYLKSSSKALYGEFGEPYKSKLPYTFTDAYGKINVSSSNGSKINLFGFSFNDRVNYQNTSDLEWKSNGGGTNFVLTPGVSSSIISGGFYYSDYKIGLTEADNRPRRSEINGFDANVKVTSYFENHSELNYGVEFTGFKTAYQYYNFIGILQEQNDYTTQVGAFVKLKKNFGDRFVLEPGVRVQYYASLPVTRLEPRIAMKLNITENIRLKAAAGMYSQNIISSKSDKDIVNFFTGFLTAPDFEIQKPDGTYANNNIQKAYHLIGGIEVDAGGLEFTLEPWYKYFGQLITINRYKLLPTDPDFSIETGKAYGVDFTAKYSKGRYYVWGVYSYGYVDRNDGHQTYPTPFDRRHNINILASYTAGKHYDWEFSVRFNYGSAFPFTQTQAFYENVDFSNGIGTNYLTQNGNLGILYADKINGGRLSDYHRMDISMKKKFVVSKHSVVEASGSISNVYNQQNIFYIDRVRNKREYQLPIFPTLGLSWNF